MTETPIRHLLLLAILLFVILSSGCLQCALNCYERAAGYAAPTSLVADCHPLAREELTSSPTSDFCHNSHSSTHATGDPGLYRVAAQQAIALLNIRCETPDFRSAEPFETPLTATTVNVLLLADTLPLSQNLKELRSTILLI